RRRQQAGKCRFLCVGRGRRTTSAAVDRVTAYIFCPSGSLKVVLEIKRSCTTPCDARLVDRAAQALFAGAPPALLARWCGVLVAKATARTGGGTVAVCRRMSRNDSTIWRKGVAECCELCRDFDNAIARRDGEFIPRRGFVEIRERDSPGSVPR